MVVAEGHVMGLEGLVHVFVEGEVHVPVVAVFAPDAHNVVNAVAAVLAQAHKGGGIGQDAAVHGNGLEQGGCHILGGAVIRQREDAIDTAVRLTAVVLDGAGRHVAVGDVDGGVVQGVELRVEQTHRLDHAALPGGLDKFTGHKGLGHQQRKPGEEIGQHVLHRQGQRQADHADQRDQRAGVDAQRVGDSDHGNDPQQDVRRAAHEAAQGAVKPGGAVEQPIHQAHEQLDGNEADHKGRQGGEQGLHRGDADGSEKFRHKGSSFHFGGNSRRFVLTGLGANGKLRQVP